MSCEEQKKETIEVCVLGCAPIRLARYPSLTHYITRKKGHTPMHDPLAEFRGSVFYDLGLDSETLLTLPAQIIKRALLDTADNFSGLPSRAKLTRSIYTFRGEER
jgi:hypothetical protein